MSRVSLAVLLSCLLFCLACRWSSPPVRSDPPDLPDPQSNAETIDHAWSTIKGYPYVWGGESIKEGGFDCSGAIYHVQKVIGRPVPRTTARKYWILAAGPVTAWQNARAGSWIWWTFNPGRPYGHIGMQTKYPFAWESGSSTGPAKIRLRPGGFWDVHFSGSKQLKSG